MPSYWQIARCSVPVGVEAARPTHHSSPSTYISFRKYLRPLAATALSALLLADVSIGHAQLAPAYTRISPPVPSDTPGKIEVLWSSSPTPAGTAPRSTR